MNQKSQSQSQSKMSATTKWGKQERRTDVVQVPSKWVGLIIGEKGVTVKRIAQSAGKGCHINHSRDPLLVGRFEISAWNSTSVAFAKKSIVDLVASKTSKPKPQSKPQTKTKKPDISVLYQSDSDSDSDDDINVIVSTKKPPTKPKQQCNKKHVVTHLTGFKPAGQSLATLKRQGWERSKAYREMMTTIGSEWDNLDIPQRKKAGGWDNYKWHKVGEFNKTMKTNTETKLPSHMTPQKPSLDASSFPQCGGGSASTTTGAWGRNLTNVMSSEPVKPAPVVETKAPVMTPLRQKVDMEELEFMNAGRASRQTKAVVEANDAWSDSEDDQPPISTPSHRKKVIATTPAPPSVAPDSWDTSQIA